MGRDKKRRHESSSRSLSTVFSDPDFGSKGGSRSKSYDSTTNGNRTHNDRTYRGSSGTRKRKSSHDRNLRIRRFADAKISKMSKHTDSSRDQSSNDGWESTRDSSRRRVESSRKHHRRLSRDSNRDDHSHDEKDPRSREEAPENDSDGHIKCHRGDWIQNRYKVMGYLGEGTFGQCFDVWDRKRRQTFALKVVRNVKKYRESAKLEIKVLKKIVLKDPDQQSLCIHAVRWFDYFGHICIAFEKLGKSVYDFLKDNSYQPFPVSQVRHIAFQLLHAVKFLHSMRLVHTDLKLENMLFVNSDYEVDYVSSKVARKTLFNTDIRLIDFGSAIFDWEYHGTVVSTRHYRAPEVILELGWSYPCDIWSCGCILFELYTGNTLFQTHDNMEHLAMMERILGLVPRDMALKSKKAHYFLPGGKLNWDEQSSDGLYVIENCLPLLRYARTGDALEEMFFDLVMKLLDYDIGRRYSAVDALQHPFFKGMSCGFSRNA